MFFQCTQYDNFLSFVCTSCAACGAANRAALTFGIWQLFSGVLLALELGEWCLVLRTFFLPVFILYFVFEVFHFRTTTEKRLCLAPAACLASRRLELVELPCQGAWNCNSWQGTFVAKAPGM